MSISREIKLSNERSSWIRKMFEEGAKLKKQFGAENVFDFSLGNPDVDPPKEFFKTLESFGTARKQGVHGYMPNAGFPDVCARIAANGVRLYGEALEAKHIIMTCGAAGGLNIIFKTILDPEDEVIVPSPYFVEYGFYVKNHGGTLVPVPTRDDFSLDIGKIRKAISAKTKAVLINSPNNPTGCVYTEQELRELAALLREHSTGGRTIYLVSDEPYREIVYDGVVVPSLFALYENSLIVTSYSKTLSIPGERIGYVAVHPRCDELDALLAGLILSNRILGFVNAPALMQRVVAELLDCTVDTTTYKRRRDLFVAGLRDGGYDFVVPRGAFYIFCKSPSADDVKFVRHLLTYNVLAVPGSGFGAPGYFRLAYCVAEDTISRALPKFKQALREFKE